MKDKKTSILHNNVAVNTVNSRVKKTTLKIAKVFLLAYNCNGAFLLNLLLLIYD